MTPVTHEHLRIRALYDAERMELAAGNIRAAAAIRAKIEEALAEPPLTKAGVEGMDSTIGELK